MTILIAIISLLAGMAIGGGIVYMMEKKHLDALIERCNDTNEKLAEMIKQEEDFMESMWPKKKPHITMETNMADYLKNKYLSNEDRDWSDCEDESDNLYV